MSKEDHGFLLIPELEGPQRAFDAWIFKDQIMDNLIRLVDKIDASKVLPKSMIIWKDLKPLFRFIIDKTACQKRNMNLDFMSFRAEVLQNLKDTREDTTIFLIPPEKDVLKCCVELIKDYQSKEIKKVFYLIIYPQRNFFIKNEISRLEDSERFFQRVLDFNIDMIPFDNDLVSLEYKASLRELYISHEYTMHNLAAESIYRLNMMLGIPKSTFIKGN